jgi:hypothetical protein
MKKKNKSIRRGGGQTNLEQNKQTHKRISVSGTIEFQSYYF